MLNGESEFKKIHERGGSACAIYESSAHVQGAGRQRALILSETNQGTIDHKRNTNQH